MAKFEVTTKTQVTLAKEIDFAFSNGAFLSDIIDTAGFESVTFAIAASSAGATDGTVTPSLIAGNDSNLSDGVLVPENELVSGDGSQLPTVEATFNLPADINLVARLGYIGAKQFVRLEVTGAAITLSVAVTLSIYLSNPLHAPTEIKVPRIF